MTEIMRITSYKQEDHLLGLVWVTILGLVFGFGGTLAKCQSVQGGYRNFKSVRVGYRIFLHYLSCSFVYYAKL